MAHIQLTLSLFSPQSNLFFLGAVLPLAWTTSSPWFSVGTNVLEHRTKVKQPIEQVRTGMIHLTNIASRHRQPQKEQDQSVFLLHGASFSDRSPPGIYFLSSRCRDYHYSTTSFFKRMCFCSWSNRSNLDYHSSDYLTFPRRRCLLTARAVLSLTCQLLIILSGTQVVPVPRGWLNMSTSHRQALRQALRDQLKVLDCIKSIAERLMEQEKDTEVGLQCC